MCGLSGIFSQQALNEGRWQQLETMTAVQQHRGPENTGYWKSEFIAFGHNRLSLIDLHERANQPFRNGRYALIYNGEIYNFQEIGKALTRDCGVHFEGHSDTEVLFHALANWGPEFTLKRISGMFAFAWADTQDGTLILARDRIGIKPLFYGTHGNSIYFSSELKALTSLDIPWTLDARGLMAAPFGAYEYTRKRSAFREIRQIEPGTMVSWNPEGGLEPKVHRYFTLTDMVSASSWQRRYRGSVEQVQEEFESIFRVAVKDTMVADAGMGAFASGGIDSSLISAVAFESRPVTLYTSNVVGRFSEVDQARLLAKHLAARLECHDFEPEQFLRDWVKTTWHYESPIVVHTSAVPFQNVAALTRLHGDKAVLTGEGSDELFLGYPRLLTRRYDALLQMPVRVVHAIYKRIPGLTRYLNLNRTNYLEDVSFMAQDFERERAEAAHAEAYDFLKGDASYKEQLETPSMIERGLHSLLWRNDRMGMMHSIESRFPFLDDRMIEFSLNLPVKFKIGKTARFSNYKHPFLMDKAIVRRMAGKLLPADLARLSKKGFFMYGHMYLRLEPGFFRDGFWQQSLGMSQPAVEHMCRTEDPYLLAKIASVEIWGRLFLWKQSTGSVEQALMPHARMTVKPGS